MKFSVYGSEDNNEDLFCARFSPDDQFIAVGNVRGDVAIYKTETGERSPYVLSQKQGNFAGAGAAGGNKPITVLEDSSTSKGLPVMSVAWRPETEFIKQKNILLVARTDGTLQQYHAVNGKCLGSINPYADLKSSMSSAEKRSIASPLSENTNQINSLAGKVGKWSLTSGAAEKSPSRILRAAANSGNGDTSQNLLETRRKTGGTRNSGGTLSGGTDYIEKKPAASMDYHPLPALFCVNYALDGTM